VLCLYAYCNIISVFEVHIYVMFVVNTNPYNRTIETTLFVELKSLLLALNTN
jgi:hypothetical protein